jgi:hypothetical protein
MKKSGKARKKVLASPSQIFGTHVEHPGLTPRPFIRPALDVAGTKAVEAFKKSLAQSMKTAIRNAAKKYVPARGPQS